MSDVTAESKLNTAREKKESGNAAFKAGNYKQALLLYHESILYVQGLEKSLASAMDSTLGGGSDAAGETAKRRPRTEAELLLVTLYNNMSAIHLKLGNWKRAMETADQALLKDEDNAKAGFRKAQALVYLGERTKAIKLLEELVKSHPQDADIARELELQKRKEQISEIEHEKAFKDAWKGKFSFNRQTPT